MPTVCDVRSESRPRSSSRHRTACECLPGKQRSFHARVRRNLHVSWSTLLARTFDLDRPRCGGRLEVRAVVTDHDVARGDPRCYADHGPRSAVRRFDDRIRTCVRVTEREPMAPSALRATTPSCSRLFRSERRLTARGVLSFVLPLRLPRYRLLLSDLLPEQRRAVGRLTERRRAAARARRRRRKLGPPKRRQSWGEPGRLFRLMTPAQKQALFDNTARSIASASLETKRRHIENCTKADPAYGAGVARAMGLATDSAADRAERMPHRLGSR